MLDIASEEEREYSSSCDEDLNDDEEHKSLHEEVKESKKSSAKISFDSLPSHLNSVDEALIVQIISKMVSIHCIPYLLKFSSICIAPQQTIQTLFLSLRLFGPPTLFYEAVSYL